MATWTLAAPRGHRNPERTTSQLFGYKHSTGSEGRRTLEVNKSQAGAIRFAADSVLAGWSLANVAKAPARTVNRADGGTYVVRKFGPRKARHYLLTGGFTHALDKIMADLAQLDLDLDHLESGIEDHAVAGSWFCPAPRIKGCA